MSTIGRQERAPAGTTVLAEDLAALTPVEAPSWVAQAAALAAVCARVRRDDEVAVTVLDDGDGLRVPVDVSGDPTFADLLVRVTAAAEKAAAGAGHEAAERAEVVVEGVKLSAERPAGAATPALDRLVHTFLRAAVARPDDRVSRLPLLEEAEVAAAVGAINGSTESGGVPSTLHGLFERRAAEAPERVAVTAGGVELTFAELERRSRSVADALVRRGACLEDRVGLCARRSLDLVVAELGILRAGCACVPLEPDYPDERLRLLLDDAPPRLVLAEEPELARLAALGSTAICLREIASEEGDARPLPRVAPLNAAFVFFTSGTTGRPKGVVVPHEGLANRVRWGVRFHELGGDDRVLFKAPYSFDASVAEIFTPLATGGALVVAEPGAEQDPAALAGLIREEGVTVAHFVPPMLRALVDEPAFAGCESLRVVWSGGQALPRTVADAFFGASQAHLANQYGPTEASVNAIAGRCDRESDAVPIGRPLPNTRAYVLDERLSHVPPGVPGEIFLSGVGVARGYLGRSAATAERFLPDPFAANGERMYRTGDLGRFAYDGTIEFLGRLDDQVKVRGFRVEPAEVEAVLGEHESVAAAAVLARPQGDVAQLVAFAVPTPESAHAVDGLARRRCGDRLAPLSLNDHETDFLFRDIFERNAYFRHGIHVRDGDCVVDVGANVGMFMLRVHELAEPARYVAFEPNPDVSRVLALNARLHDLRVETARFALGAAEGTAVLTSYPGFSYLSGLHADPEQERELVRSFLRREAERDADFRDRAAEAGEGLEELVEARLATVEHEVPVRRLSGVLRELGVETIDLLKVNVEKAELDVLRGLEPDEWTRVRQVVLEVHDLDGRLKVVHGLLERAGLDVVSERDWSVDESEGVFYVYARRPGTDRPAAERPPRRLGRLPLEPEELREHLAARLPEFMLPSEIGVVEELPTTPTGKLDRAALLAAAAPEQPPAQEAAAPEPAAVGVAAEVAAIWEEVLGLEQVGPDSNFFDLGGHSLALAQVMARVRRRFSVDLPLRAVFEVPTVAALASAIEEAGVPAEAPAEVAAPREDLTEAAVPLSAAQQGLWLLDQLRPPTVEYNDHHVLRLAGPVLSEVLEQALREIVARHESLRTRFAVDDGVPVQVVEAELPVELEVVEAGASEAEVAAAVAEVVERPFDLAAGPLFRAALVRASDDDHVLVLVAHHTVCDAWSWTVFTEELNTLYDAFEHGRPSPLEPMRAQYRDFVAWESRRFDAETLAREQAWWRDELAGAPPVLDLPTDHARPAVRTPAGGRHRFEAPAALTRRLEALAQAHDATLFMALLAGFSWLLSRYSGRSDVVVGAPVANRGEPEFESLFGFLINTIALRSDCAGDPTFREQLARTRETAVGALAHKELPFERVVEAVAPVRDLRWNPIYQVSLVLQNAPAPARRFGEHLVATDYAVPQSTAKFDLTLEVIPASDGFRCSFEYSEDLYERETIERLSQHFLRLVEAVVEDPDQRLSQIGLAAPAEREQLLADWNATAADYPRDRCVHELFEAQAARRPDEVAVSFDGGTLTYAELNARANRLARLLRCRGAGPETFVGVCAERSVETIIGNLAALKAGAAYLPLDADYPRERLAFMLDDARAPLVLAPPDLAGSLPVECDRIVPLDLDCTEAASYPRDDLEPRARLENVAYVNYTSGSTGVPKGICITHADVVWLVENASYTQVGPDDVVAFASSPAFDAATWECWVSLAHGARIAVVPREVLLQPGRLGAELERRGVTAMYVTTALMHLLSRQEPSFAASLDKLVFGGQVADPGAAARILGASPPRQLVNVYGPTETTVFCACVAIEHAEDGQALSVGHAMPNAQQYLLDADLNPAPLGVPGEIFIGGDGLARGYLNRPRLTAERFLPNPYGAPGSRVYRSGDVGRNLTDGRVVVLGRTDDQVKVRGFRIELGEVEAAILAHQDVAEAAVVVRGEDEEARLVAHVVARDGGCASQSLPRFLRDRLPEYMLPAAIVELPSLPMTPNGKIDRGALPDPDGERPEVEREYVAPRDETEAAIARIWTDVLEVDSVGVEDDFFELGGHSLLATRVLARIRSTLEVEIDTRAAFDARTIAELARLARTLPRTADTPIRRQPRRGQEASS